MKVAWCGISTNMNTIVDACYIIRNKLIHQEI